MSDDNRTYCKLVEGGFAANAIKKFHEDYASATQAWFDFAGKYGPEDPKIYSTNSFIGIEFPDDQVPAGWIACKTARTCSKPSRRKPCMEAYREYKALPVRPGGFHFAGLLKCGPIFAAGRALMPTFETIGEEVILSVPNGADIPEGAIPMKTSEYWMMLEANEEDGK